jgi:hypothetical protein
MTSCQVIARVSCDTSRAVFRLGPLDGSCRTSNLYERDISDVTTLRERRVAVIEERMVGLSWLGFRISSVANCGIKRVTIKNLKHTTRSDRAER